MKRKNILTIALALTGLFAAGTAHAVPIQPNQWYTFRTVAGGATAGCLNNSCVGIAGTTAIGDGPWTFSGAGIFEVNDAFTLLDQFELFDFGTSLGVTSTPAMGGSCGSNLATCLSEPGASRASFVLGAGNHSITITNLLEAGGAHLFRFSSRELRLIPEPATAALVALGLAGARLGRRRDA